MRGNKKGNIAAIPLPPVRLQENRDDPLINPARAGL